MVAERNTHAYDDGVVTKEEEKALEEAHKRQLHNRHRGIAQFRPYRTAIWMKQGVKDRVIPKKKTGKRERRSTVPRSYGIIGSPFYSHC